MATRPIPKLDPRQQALQNAITEEFDQPMNPARRENAPAKPRVTAGRVVKPRPRARGV